MNQEMSIEFVNDEPPTKTLLAQMADFLMDDGIAEGCLSVDQYRHRALTKILFLLIKEAP